MNEHVCRDAGTIVIGWLVKIALVLAVVGIVGFDSIAIASGHLNTTDDANSAASAAAAEYQSSHSVQSALVAAKAAVTNPNEVLIANTLTINPDGSATVVVERTITTLVMNHFGPLKKYTDIKVRGQATPPTP